MGILLERSMPFLKYRFSIKEELHQQKNKTP